MSPSYARPKLTHYEDTSEDTIVIAAKEKGSISAIYCAANNSNMTNCREQTGMPEMSMHYFSKDKTLLHKWIQFVRIHRKDFLSVKKPALCCTHFDILFCYVLPSIVTTTNYVPSKNFVRSPRLLGFKKGKKITSVDFSQISFVISQSRHNKLQKRENKLLLQRHLTLEKN